MRISAYNAEQVYAARFSFCASKSYGYEFHAANKEDFQKYYGRWIGEDSRLAEISKRCLTGEYRWDVLLDSFSGKGPIAHLAEARGGIQIGEDSYAYRRDLRGTLISEMELLAPVPSLHYCTFDYCCFRKCAFNFMVASSKLLFFENSIKFVLFQQCQFKHIDFFSGEYENVVFENCEFDNVVFIRNDGSFKSVIFLNCSFTKTNFTRISLSEVCFLGNCQFDQIIINSENMPAGDEIIGKKIIKQLYDWDKASYRCAHRFRRGSKEFSERYHYFERSLQCYQGLASFYQALAKSEEAEGFYENYTRWAYLHLWTKSQHILLHNGMIRSPGQLVYRYIFGYGFRPLRPLMAWLMTNLICSVLYLFLGINYAGNMIKRSVHVDFKFFSETLHDFLICLYYSVITATTVGYGDISPTKGFAMALAASHAVAGLILMTFCTVILTRRFWK